MCIDFIIRLKLDVMLFFHSLLLCLPKEINLNSNAKMIQVKGFQLGLQ